MSQKVEINGEEVEVFTAEEHQAAIAQTRTAVEGEFTPKLTAAETEKARLEGILEARTKEFGQARGEFKRLSDEQYAKLDEKDRIIYDNQVLLADKDKIISEADTKAYESAVDSAIRARVGSNAELFTKVKEMYKLINLEDVTPEGIAARASAALGALGQTQPDLLATAGFGGGGFSPPTRDTRESFADSDRGREIAGALGIKIELTPEEKKAAGIK